MRTVWCLVVAILLFGGVACDCHAKQTGWASEWQTNDGKLPLLFTNVVTTNSFKLVTGAPPIFSTNLVVTNVFIPMTTNYGPWGPGGPPAPPPKKPWYKRFWEWIKNWRGISGFSGVST